MRQVGLLAGRLHGHHVTDLDVEEIRLHRLGAEPFRLVQLYCFGSGRVGAISRSARPRALVRVLPIDLGMAACHQLLLGAGAINKQLRHGAHISVGGHTSNANQ